MPITYIIPVKIEVLEYYEGLKEDILTVFKSLLFVYQNHLLNLGQAFLLPTGYFIPDDEKQRWYNIAEIKNFLTDIDPNLRVNVDLAKEDENQMKEVILVDFIYKLNRDILMKNPKGLLKYE